MQVTLRQGKAMENDHTFSCETYVKATNVTKMHLQHLKKLIARHSIQLAIDIFLSPLTLSVRRQSSLKRCQDQSCRAGGRRTHRKTQSERTEGSESQGHGRPRRDCPFPRPLPLSVTPAPDRSWPTSWRINRFG